MKTYLIGYDLNSPGQDYSGLINAIKALANGYWHHLDSTWLVNTSLDAGQIRDTLKPELDANDELLVIRVGGNWATYGLPDSANNWLRTNLKPVTV